MHEIILNVKSVQESRGAEPLIIEFVSEGKHYQKNGYHYIIYQETELSGLAGHKTSLRLAADSVTMRRYGEMPITMLFQVDQHHSADYYTPYGAIKIDYFTTALACQLSTERGSISIQYQLTINGLEQSTHQLDINYRSAAANG